MTKVYVVRAFDGDYSVTREIFSSLEKANKYKQNSIKEDIEHYGCEIDTYIIDEYELK